MAETPYGNCEELYGRNTSSKLVSSGKDLSTIFHIKLKFTLIHVKCKQVICMKKKSLCKLNITSRASYT